MNIKWIIIILLFMMSPSGSGIFTISSTILPLRQYKIEQQLAEQRKAQAIIDAENAAKEAEEEAYNKLHTFLGLTKDELVGYARFQTPISHYKLNKIRTYDNKRIYDYYNSISSVEFYYVEDLTDNDKANPGKNILKFTDEPEVEKITVEGISNKLEIVHLVSEGEYDGFDREAYIVYKDKSAFIIDAYLDKETDKTAFRESIQVIIPTINVYYVADLVFHVPNSGYWEGYVPQGGSSNEQGNTEDKNENTGTETGNNKEYVGGNVEGTIKTNLVSNNWKDLRIVLDGLVIDMQDPLDKLLEDGYKFANTSNVPDTVAKGKEIIVWMYKDNGVAVKVRAYNNTESALKPGNLIITGITVDKSKFDHYTNNSKYTSENLPELILVNGITWGIKFDTIKGLNGTEYSTKEESDGTYVITYDQQIEYMQIKTENYKNIKEVTLEYDYVLNQQEIEQEQQEAEAES